MITHPFHPLFGKRLDVLFARRDGGARLYMCDDGEGRSVALPKAANRWPALCAVTGLNDQQNSAARLRPVLETA